MISDLSFVWRNRSRPVFLSQEWVKAQGKRLFNMMPLIRHVLQKVSLRLRGAQISPSAICSRLDLQGKAGNLSIGEFTSIGRVTLQCHDKISIGNCVVINDGVKMLTGSHDINSKVYEHRFRPISIGDYAWIASNALILQGVTIGYGAVIGAGAVVVKSVPPFSVVGGNPARQISERNRFRFEYRPSTWFAALEAWLERDAPQLKKHECDIECERVI